MTRPHDQDDTAVFIAGGRFSEDFFERSPHPLRFEFGAATHPGKVRPVQDPIGQREEVFRSVAATSISGRTSESMTRSSDFVRS